MVDDRYSKNSIITSMVWKLMERSGTQFVQFVVQIVLARILLPNDYAALAILNIFILISNVFVQSGFNTALIQKKEVNETDYSSAFYVSLGIAILLYLAIFLSAPVIDTFFNREDLTDPLRVFGITLLIGAMTSILNAKIARKMQFRKQMLSSLIGIVVSGGISIYLALQGAGIWALVVQQIVFQSLSCIILFLLLDFRPKLIFSLSRTKELISFGWKILVAGIIDNTYNQLRSLFIGKLYKGDILGFYSRGQQFPLFIAFNVNGAIQSVMLPALSSKQDNKEDVRSMVRRGIKTSAFIVFPIMAGLIACAEPLVTVVLTEKWLPSVPFIQICSLAYALWPIHTANIQAINAIGRSDIFLKLEVIKKSIGIGILVGTAFINVYWIAIGGVVSGVISAVLNIKQNEKLLGYSLKEQVKDILPSLLISSLMGVVVYCISMFSFSAVYTLIIQILIGIAIYIMLSRIFKLEEYYYLIDTLKEWKSKRK